MDATAFSRQPDSNSPTPLEPVVVSDDPKRKKKKTPKKPVEPPKNLFDDETARWLLKLVKGKKELPQVILPNVSPLKTKTKPDDVQEELAAAIRERLLPWIWSILLHACFLLPLALMFLPYLGDDDLTVISGIGDELTEFVRDENLGLSAIPIEKPIFVDVNLPEVVNPLADLPKIEKADVGESAPTSERETKNISGLSPNGRDPGRRVDMLGRGGGNGETEQAVIDGLRWLVKVQQTNGRWSLSQPYNFGAAKDQDDQAAATAMALLAFQGFGVTPSSRHPMLVEFALPVAKGWDWLLRQQDDNGCFFRSGIAAVHTNNHRFYTHGLCTIAICELYGMTKDETLREPAQKAVDYCVRTQNVAGGWRYVADQFSTDADVSVTGWIVMALKSAQGNGLKVPERTFQRIAAFLDETSRDGGSQYVYRSLQGELPKISMTAEGLLCRQLLGWEKDDPRLVRGIELLADPEHQIDFESETKRDVYSWYYATQVIHHVGGEPWKQWNARMRTELPKFQEKKGASAGSWHPREPQPDEWGKYYGRLYTTCLSIFMLEVYYRHLSVYE